MRKMQKPTHAQELVELRNGRPLGDLLRDLYQGQGLSHEAIAEKLGVSRPTVAKWLAENQIPTREVAA